MDTIAAAATAPGKSGIGIIRISGDKALKIADKIFLSPRKDRPSGFKTHTLHYGWIIDKRKSGGSGLVLDEVLLTVMRRPRSYTREDTVEINCHGGVVALRSILELALSCGARLARPGEFTQRAFISGRIDLAQAEAVLDIIQAKTDAALRLAGRQLSGGLSSEIGEIREGLLSLLAEIEAILNFPEEETAGEEKGKWAFSLSSFLRKADSLLRSAGLGRLVREGVSVAICGRPNVGKSSLLNALLKEERAIVTPCPGTTRDVIEEVLDIRGIPVTIADTAGISAARDVAEARAVERAYKYLSGCSLVLFVLDAGCKLSSQDVSLIKRVGHRAKIAVLNKIDLPVKLGRRELRPYFSNIVSVSALQRRGLESLEQAIGRIILEGKTEETDRPILGNIRHKQCLEKSAGFMRNALWTLNSGWPEDLVARDLREAINCLDEITGKKVSDNLLDNIFSRFCIGK